tara:strand:+ start:8079 stop:8675 length:597 start_codon:yes stop_codon:yes gene_type:complete
MPEKPINRPMDIPMGRPIEEEGDMMSQAMGGEAADELPDITPEEEGQVDQLLGSMLDFVWGDGYDTIVNKIRSGQDNLEKTLGNIAGQMVNKEVVAAGEAGVNVSRDILIGVAAELINNLAEIALHEEIMYKGNDESQEQMQGEALIYAIERYGELGDPGMDPQQPVRLAQSILRGKYPDKVASKMGYRAPEEEIAHG